MLKKKIYKTSKNVFFNYCDLILLLLFIFLYQYSFYSNSIWINIINNNFNNYQNFYTFCLPNLSDACSYIKGAFFLLDPIKYSEHYWTNNLWPPGMFHLHLFFIKTEINNPYIYLNFFVSILWSVAIYMTLKKIKLPLVKLLFILFIGCLILINKNITNILFSEAYFCIFTVISFIFLNSKKNINIIIGVFFLYLTILFHIKNFYLFLIIEFILIISLFYYKFVEKFKFKNYFFYELLKKIFLMIMLVNFLLLLTYSHYMKRQGTAYVYKMVWGKEDVLSNGINKSACKVDTELCMKIQNGEISDLKTITKITLLTFFKNPFEWTYYKIPIMFLEWSKNNFLFSILEIIMFLVVSYKLLRKRDYFNFSLFFSLFAILITSVIVSIEARYFYQLKIAIIFYFFIFLSSSRKLKIF